MSESSSEGDGTALLVVSTGNFAQLGARFLLGAVVPFVLADFGTSETAVGGALTAMWALYALLQFPSGVLADRYGERRLLVLGLGGTVVGAALVAVAPTLLLFGVATLLLGAGTGLYFSPASSYVSRAHENAGLALSALTAGGGLAGIVYPAFGGTVSARYGWRLAMGAGAAVAVPVLVATAWAAPDLPPANPDRSLRASLDADRIRDLLGRPSFAFSTAIAVLVSFMFQTFASFFPTFLVQYRGVEKGVAGLVFGAVFGVSSLAQVAAGRLSDATSRDLAIASSVTLAGAGLVVLLAVEGTVGLVVGAGLFGVGLSWPGPVQARIMDQLEDAERGYGFGLARTIYMLLAAPGSVLVGYVAATAGWGLGYLVPVLVLGTCLAAIVLNHSLGLDL